MKTELALLAVVGCYSDNDGAFDMYQVWTGVGIDAIKVIGRTNNYVPATRPATIGDIEAAKTWYLANTRVSAHSVQSIGCTYIVSGSRKIAKGTIVTVIDYAAPAYKRSEQSLVQLDDGRTAWISSNCLTCVAVELPSWLERARPTELTTFAPLYVRITYNNTRYYSLITSYDVYDCITDALDIQCEIGNIDSYQVFRALADTDKTLSCDYVDLSHLDAELGNNWHILVDVVSQVSQVASANTYRSSKTGRYCTQAQAEAEALALKHTALVSHYAALNAHYNRMLSNFAKLSQDSLNLMFKIGDALARLQYQIALTASN